MSPYPNCVVCGRKMPPRAAGHAGACKEHSCRYCKVGITDRNRMKGRDDVCAPCVKLLGLGAEPMP